MKYFSILLAVLLVACSQPKEDVQPADLAGKKALLAEKMAEMKNLEAQISLLKKEISELSPVAEKDKVTVSIDTIVKEKFIRFIDLQGTVQSEDLVNAASEIGGRILQLTVKEGSPVSKGQLIAKTDAEAIRTQKDELTKALDLANDVFDRQKRLWDQNIGSEIQYLQAKNNKERLEKSLLTIDAQLRKSNVYAPISGVVDMVFLKQGEVAGPGVPIVQILNTARVKVVCDVPENYLGKIKTGNKVDIHFPNLNKTISKPVTMLGRTIDPSNRTFKIEINVDNVKNELKPNLLSVIKINDYEMNNAIVVPMEIIQQEVSGQKYVYVADQKENIWVAKKVNITTGESTEGRTVISSGLAAGDKIIMKGYRSVTNGQPIEPENTKM
jgi:membrane fusion protein (multidrug efflux system)